MKTYYKASWGTLLKVITTAVCAFAIIVAIYNPNIIIIIVMGAIVLVPAVWMIRGYSLQDQKLIIHRLGWSNKVDLKNLQDIKVEPEAMKGSLRILGNGGLFGWIGTFKNKTLGTYRAYATNRHKCVVLIFKNNRKIVVSPDTPREFVKGVKEKGSRQ